MLPPEALGENAFLVFSGFVPRLVSASFSALSFHLDSENEVAQSCPTLYNPVDYSLPGSSIHWILQARILEWVAISSARGSSPPRDQTQVS